MFVLHTVEPHIEPQRECAHVTDTTFCFHDSGATHESNIVSYNVAHSKHDRLHRIPVRPRVRRRRLWYRLCWSRVRSQLYRSQLCR
jgi:hypothetical protein